MTSNKNLWVALIVVAIIAIGGLFYPHVQQTVSTFVGGVTNYDTIGSSGLQLGSGCNDSNNTCTGTTFTGFVGASCDLIGTNASQAASTTVAYDCAVTNMTSSFKTVAQLATSTPTVGGSGAVGSLGWAIVASKASTTSGFVTVMLANLTGIARVPSATNVGSSTTVWAFK